MSVLLEAIAAAKPDDTAIIDEHRRTTWAELDRRVDAVAASLARAGIGEGSTIAAVLGNRIELLELTLACLGSGVLLVPANRHLVADELAYLLDDAGAELVVVDESTAKVARATGSTVRRLVIGEPAAGEIGWGDFTDADPAGAPAAVRGGVMFYTSGTTGRPKGVRGSLAVTGGDPVMWQLMAGTSSMFGLAPESPVHLLAGPAYHSAQWVFTVFSLLSGAAVSMLDRFDPEELLEVIERDRVTNTFLVPTQIARLLRLTDDVRARHDTSSLVAVHHGGAPCSPRIKHEAIEWLGPVVHEFYGGTEGGFITMITPEEWLARPTSVGRPTSLVEVVIADDEGRVLGPGETGQVYFRSTLDSTFEYHNAPDKTADAHLAPGVATLGDVGHLDADGYLHLTDRKIDLIISGGVNIYPAEIESVLTTHPAVDDAAVFGVPDDDFGEAVHAVVEAPGAPIDLADELLARCEQSLARFKRPRRIEVVEALPRTEVGKVAKRELREPHWTTAGRSI